MFMAIKGFGSLFKDAWHQHYGLYNLSGSDKDQYE